DLGPTSCRKEIRSSCLPVDRYPWGVLIPLCGLPLQANTPISPPTSAQSRWPQQPSNKSSTVSALVVIAARISSSQMQRTLTWALGSQALVQILQGASKAASTILLP